MSGKLGIISVVYENYAILNDLFTSLEDQTNKNFKVFLVDSSKNKIEITKPNLDLSIINSGNFGYAHGVNLGIKSAIYQGVTNFCVINSDIYVNKNFIENIFKSLKKNFGALIGGKIYYAPGFEYHKNRYQKSELGKILWYAGGKIDWKNAFTKHLGVDLPDSKEFNNEQKTDFITGCFMAFDKKVIDKVGFWNENYFLYYEDADFCERAKRNNIDLIYDPSIILWHKNAQSTDGSGSLLHQKYQKDNRLKFGLKYAPLKTKLHLLKNWVFQQ